MLVLEDQGGEPLGRLLGAPMEVGRFLHLAIGITVALGRVHQAGLVRKEVKPANILVNRAGEVRLTGFGIASRVPRERSAPEPPETIAGTLAYMAPEQTGRMNRSVMRAAISARSASRSTRCSPAPEWVHCHVARKPVPPAERLKGVPSAVSAVIMKLLAKTAEERYHTAFGLENDRRHCLAGWEVRGGYRRLSTGQQDTPDQTGCDLNVCSPADAARIPFGLRCGGKLLR